MKKLLVLAVLLSCLPISSFAQKKAPYYFPPGVIQTSDPILQKQEYVRYLNATNACFQGNKADFDATLPEPGSVSVQTDIDSTSSITDPHAKMRIVMDHVVRIGNQVRVTDLCHQYFITDAELKYAVDDLKQVVIEAAQADFDFYNTTYDLAIAARAAKLGIKKEVLVAQLDEKVPGYNITFRELHCLPKPMKVTDFIPRELHLGYNIPLGGILGVTWLNTGVIYYNPDARIVDWLDGRPKVMSHEMVHCNVNIEKFPMASAFDAELIASIPEMLWAEDHLDLPNHGYARDLRELAEIYFNFDFKQMEKETFVMDFAGNTVINEERYRYYYAQLQQVKAEMLKFYQTVTIPEFYSDPVWWGAINNIRGDNNTVFRITMADHYNPTLLGGSKETVQWLESHHDDIMDMATHATARALQGKGRDSDRGQMIQMVPSQLVNLYNQTFSASEKAKIEDYFTKHPEKLTEVMAMKPAEAIQFLMQFKVKNMGAIAQ